MDINDTNNLYLVMMYIYLKSYEDAVSDFELAVKNCGYPDMALEAIKQKYSERVDKVASQAWSAGI